MPRVTAIKLNGMVFPLKEDRNHNVGYMIKQISGIGDLTFEHTELNHNQFFTSGGGRDLAIIIAIKPNIDYEAVRRQVAIVTPVDTDITLTVEVDFVDYATTICRVRNATFGFSEEMPEISLDLESIYTCLKLAEEVGISGLPFGLSAQLPAVTHDYTPVSVELSLVSPMAQWYRIGVSSDYISINTQVLRVNYGITDIPEGATILINSDEEAFSVMLYFPPVNGEEVVYTNIETACDIGEFGFRFIPNEPMIVSSDKIPSGLSGERIKLSCTPRVSGV